MSVDYDHVANGHTLGGPKAAFMRLFSGATPRSVLDIGCGPGTWLRAALDCGTTDIFGVDGVEIPPEMLLIDRKFFLRSDLTAPIDLGRKFEFVFCLEVAEHLDAQFAPVLIETLTRHGDRIMFSAACPGQIGQHHVNCQWPEYWQELFNRKGFVCEDSPRWQIWCDKDIEPWYRQNLFLAVRDPGRAGKEARIPAVMHPELVQHIGITARAERTLEIEAGGMRPGWYLSTPFSALMAKLQRRIAGGASKRVVNGAFPGN